MAKKPYLGLTPLKLHWWTDSQSVIDTFTINTDENIANPNHTEWIAQRDKNVWEMLLIEQEAWGDRLTLHHVESHVDKKKKTN